MACITNGEISKYLCGKPEEPKKGHVYAPYVELNIGGKFLVNCGNKSFEKDPHTMVISSMQYGLQAGNGGMKCEFEILGEGAASYKTIVELINKTIKLAEPELRNTEFRFGWLLKDCISGVVTQKLCKPIKCLAKKVNTNIDKGITKIKLECVDLMDRHNDRRVEKNEGQEGNLKTLKRAIIDLCNSQDPVIQVDFRNRDGGPLQFEIEPDGIKAVWKSNELPILSVIRNWVSKIRTKDEYGVYFKYDPEKPLLIIQEDDQCKPDENCNCDFTGKSYIVNGGNCSPVIEFSPEIDWILEAGGFGGFPNAANSGQMIKNREDKELSPIEATGTGNQQAIPSEYDFSIPQEGRGILLEKSTSAHTTANKPYDQARSIKGELKIIGEIDYSNLVETITKYVSIAVISPFQIKGNGPCNWLAQPPLNQILSNKKWMIMGVDHQIEAGKYVTTLSVSLPVPNAELSVNDPIGGDGSGGLTMPNTGDGTFRGENK